MLSPLISAQLRVVITENGPRDPPLSCDVDGQRTGLLVEPGWFVALRKGSSGLLHWWVV